MKLIQIADFVSHHLTFKGRLSRFPYLVLLLFGVLLFNLNSFLIGVIDNAAISAQTAAGDFILSFLFLTGYILYLAIWIGFILYFLCQSVRRLHDLNSPGRVYLFVLILFTGEPGSFAVLLFHIALVLLPGTKGSNKYGDDPARLNNKKVKKNESSLRIS